MAGDTVGDKMEAVPGFGSGMTVNFRDKLTLAGSDEPSRQRDSLAADACSLNRAPWPVDQFDPAGAEVVVLAGCVVPTGFWPM